MKATMLLIAGMLLLVAPVEARAARAIDASLTLAGGQVVLMTYTGDDGNATPDEVWEYLRDMKFPGQLGGGSQGGYFRIVPDKDQPLQATLTGDLRVAIQYGKGADTTKLRLVRQSPRDTKWTIHPDDFESLTKAAK